jgi:hypothetical protein
MRALVFTYMNCKLFNMVHPLEGLVQPKDVRLLTTCNPHKEIKQTYFDGN